MPSPVPSRPVPPIPPTPAPVHTNSRVPAGREIFTSHICQSNTTDSSDDGVTDKEARTPPRTRPVSPPRVSKPLSLAGRFTPARLIMRTPSRNFGKGMAAGGEVKPVVPSVHGVADREVLPPLNPVVSLFFFFSRVLPSYFLFNVLVMFWS